MGIDALRLRGVGKSYGNRAILSGIDLRLAPGECVAVMGRNGSGKSTLLRLAATLVRPTAGTVEVAGIDAGHHPEHARAGLSLLSQEAPLYPELTPREHLRWWARVQGMPDAPGRIDAALAAAGLARDGGHAHATGPPTRRGSDLPVRSLSRGTRQRLAIAMALLPDRPLLILDEPFTALDDEGRAWLVGEVAARRGRQAILLALHDEAQAAALANRTLHLRGGALQATGGTPHAIGGIPPETGDGPGATP